MIDWSRESFFIGMVRAVDMRGYLSEMIYKRVELDSVKALENAWEKVGECIAFSINAFHKDNNQQ